MLLGVDPGKKGGACVWDGERALVCKYTTESDFLDLLETLGLETHAVVEDVPVGGFPGTTPPSSFKLGYNFGFHVGAIRAYNLPLTLVRPTKWQKGLGLRPKMGYSDRKRMLADVARRLYPEVYDLSGSPAKITQAVCDAVLIMDWGRGR
tara:strand:- start:86 stop:535 length:450 start_codon:yes stop_codon:yes gene_type:complete